MAVFLTINDDLPNTELEKIGEVLPRIEVYVVAKPLELQHLFSGHKVKGEEAQTAEVVDVKGLLPLKKDYLTYQVEAFNLILFIMMYMCRAL